MIRLNKTKIILFIQFVYGVKNDEHIHPSILKAYIKAKTAPSLVR